MNANQHDSRPSVHSSKISLAVQACLSKKRKEQNVDYKLGFIQKHALVSIEFYLPHVVITSSLLIPTEQADLVGSYSWERTGNLVALDGLCQTVLSLGIGFGPVACH